VKRVKKCFQFENSLFGGKGGGKRFPTRSTTHNSKFDLKKKVDTRSEKWKKSHEGREEGMHKKKLATYEFLKLRTYETSRGGEKKRGQNKMEGGRKSLG